jgi:NAD(P)-dependent dehydrogenase (short-subunit alcohol dehydrogenase family)
MFGSMQGKTVLITGATQGIGKATATALAQKGARVVLIARNPDKGRAAATEIEAKTGSPIELIVADLSSQDEVRRAAAEFREKHDRLDVLVNNAGVLVPSRRTTVDGLEETIAVNHLAYFLLTRELLDLLHKAAPARIVNVSSEAHRRAKMAWDDLSFERRPYRPFKAYAQSKLANVLFTYELARRLDPTKITANGLHPGIIASGFGQTYGGATAFLMKLVRPFFATPTDGARTSVYLASSADVVGKTGQYFVRCSPVRSSGRSYCEASQRKLWILSEEMTRSRPKAAPSSDAAAQ